MARLPAFTGSQNGLFRIELIVGGEAKSLRSIKRSCAGA